MTIVSDAQPTAASVLAIALGLLLGRKAGLRMGAPLPGASSRFEKPTDASTKESRKS